MLYLDKVMPEGFCRFVIYANVYGIPKAKEILVKPEWNGHYIAGLKKLEKTISKL